VVASVWTDVTDGPARADAVQPIRDNELATTVSTVDDLDLVEGPTTVVLAQGMDKRLLVPDETVKALEARGITVHVGETREAVKLYNKLVDEETLVGGLFHTTC